MADLVSWLLEQITEDERLARSADLLSGGRDWSVTGDRDGERFLIHDHSDVLAIIYDAQQELLDFIAGNTPNRVLAECDAKRKVIADYQAVLEASRGIQQGRFPNFLVAQVQVLAVVLESLAAPYSDRPGYQEEWRP